MNPEGTRRLRQRTAVKTKSKPRLTVGSQPASRGSAQGMMGGSRHARSRRGADIKRAGRSIINVIGRQVIKITCYCFWMFSCLWYLSVF